MHDSMDPGADSAPSSGAYYGAPVAPGPDGHAVDAQAGVSDRARRARSGQREHAERAIRALAGMPALPLSEAARDRVIAELREATRLQEEYLLAVAHDLRNPLTSVKGQVQLLRRRAAFGIGGEQELRLRRGLDAIEVAVGRMAAMIEDLVEREGGNPGGAPTRRDDG